jgi:hypothetical protein
MLKNLKKKFAKIALVALALQLVFLGLGAGAGSARAADSSSLTTSYTEATQTVGLGKNVTDRVSLSGNIYSDAAGLPYTDYVVITNADGSAVLGTDLTVTNNSPTETAKTVIPTEKAAVSSSNPNALVLGWNGQTLTSGTFSAVNSFVINGSKAGTYKFQNLIYYTSVGDNFTNLTATDLGNQIVVDATAPTFTFSVVPSKVTDVAKTVTLNIKSDKELAKTSSGYDINVETVQGTDTPVAQTIDPSLDGINFTSTLMGLKAGNSQLVNVFVTATDTDGNSKTATLTNPADFSFILDTVAPAAVTGVTTLVNPDGSVTLSWVNPPAGTYSYLRITRDGVPMANDLGVNTTSYTDATTVKGQTYQYVIIVGDEAGNETPTTTIPPVSVSAPVVASAISDTTYYPTPTPTPTPTSTSTNTTAEVKANTTDNNTTSSNKSGFPIWAIILLIILALVGAYLIWNQKPAEQPKVTIETKNKNNSNTKKK